MLQVSSARRLEDIGPALCAAAPRHGAAVLAITHLGKLLTSNVSDPAHDAMVYTICQSELYAALLSADVRFAAFLPCRLAAIRHASGVVLETLSPKQFCALINRTDLERLAAPLETLLKDLIADAAEPARYVVSPAEQSGAHQPGAVEHQMSRDGMIPQRVDCHGTKIEDLAGTGKLDAPGG
ncbi:MAG: hypothetical protein FJW20_08090 [Acidimicrobiia bacterium]|nr:hypothetical protein [Acidimicrobiia bacterium]